MLEHRLKKPINNSNNNGKSQASVFSTESLIAKPPTTTKTFWQRLIQPWNNLNFQTKLALLIVVSTSVPVIAVTQGLTYISQKRELQQIKENLQKDGRAFAGEYVLWTQEESQSQAQKPS